MTKPFPTLALLLLLICRAAWATDWPQYRGPDRDGVWKETGVLEKFPADGLKFRWRVAIATGFSSPVICNGRVYLTDAVFLKPRADERVHCVDETTGKSLWTYVNNVGYPDWAFANDQGTGPTATPIVENGRLYTVGNRGDLFCLDAAGGQLIWKVNLEAEYRVDEFSFRSSPIIEGDLLILSLGSFPHQEFSCVVALDKKSGKLVWKMSADGLTCGSPIVITSGGKRQLIVWARKSIVSLDPAAGHVYWKIPNNIGTESGCSPPVLEGDRLLVGGVMLKLQADQPGATVLWPQTHGSRGRVLSNTSTGVMLGDYVYSARTSGELVCLEAATGNSVWERTDITGPRSGSSIHITPIGTRVLLFTDQGNLILAQLKPEGYTEISRTKLIDGTFPLDGKKRAWVPLAFANHHVFARNDKELVCVSLEAQP